MENRVSQGVEGYPGRTGLFRKGRVSQGEQGYPGRTNLAREYMVSQGVQVIKRAGLAREDRVR